MDQIGTESFDDEANESALDAFSEFLDIQIETLRDSGDLDITEVQFLETESFLLPNEENYGSEQAIAYDEALSILAFGNVSQGEIHRLAAEHGITSLDVEQYVEDVEEITVIPVIDEFEFRRLEQEQYLQDRNQFRYENF